MNSPFRGLRWLAAAAAALAVPTTAAANHLPDPEGFGHPNTLLAGERTLTMCDTADGLACLAVDQSGGGGGISVSLLNPTTSNDGLLVQTNTTEHFANAVHARHNALTGSAPVILAESNSGSPGAIAIHGVIERSTQGFEAEAVFGHHRGTNSFGIGVRGQHNGSGIGIWGDAPFGFGVAGSHSGPTGDQAGVEGISHSDDAHAAGVKGLMHETGAAAGSAGVYGYHPGTGALGIGVRGHHAGGGNGVYGSVQNSVVNAAGVLGHVLGTGGGGVGIYGAHNGSGYGVYGNAVGAGGAGVVGQAPAGGGWAGFYTGNVHVTGALSKGGGAFKIDHPLDPAHKYLQHSFVESPDMLNVYNGNVRTDRRGFATVKLPRYFQALNRDFRYQLTVIGEFAQAIVAKKIEGNRFTIRTDKPSVEVSWQVTGIRKDRWANANRIQVEQAKPASERGKYLNPELYGASKADSVLRPLAAPRVPAAKAARNPLQRSLER